MAEPLFGLIIVAVMSAIGVTLMANQMDSQSYQIAAQLQQQVADAAKYLKDNFATVCASAGPTTPVTITPQMLRNTHYLPAGFSNTNAFGLVGYGHCRRECRHIWNSNCPRQGERRG